MELKLEFNMDNAAFHDNNGNFEPGYAMVRIFQEVAIKIQQGESDGYIFDYNGNKVGTFETKGGK